MAKQTVVAVYGVRDGHNKPSRLGAGSLVHPLLVLLGPRLAEKLASSSPPSPQRVGIASTEGRLQVEVIEVKQTMRSKETESGFLWAAELTEPANSPVDDLNTDGALETVGEDPHPLSRQQLDIVRSESTGQGAQEDVAVASSQGPSQVVNKRIWCVLFPNASFCH